MPLAQHRVEWDQKTRHAAEKQTEVQTRRVQMVSKMQWGLEPWYWANPNPHEQSEGEPGTLADKAPPR